MQQLLSVFDLEISNSEAKFEIASIVELALWKAKIGEESEPQQQINDDDRQTSKRRQRSTNLRPGRSVELNVVQMLSCLRNCISPNNVCEAEF